MQNVAIRNLTNAYWGKGTKAFAKSPAKDAPEAKCLSLQDTEVRAPTCPQRTRRRGSCRA
jgi:hypothetical protein